MDTSFWNREWTATFVTWELSQRRFYSCISCCLNILRNPWFINVSGHNSNFLRVRFEIAKFCSIRPAQKNLKGKYWANLFLTEFLAVYMKSSYSSSGKSSVSNEPWTDSSASYLLFFMRKKCSWKNPTIIQYASVLSCFTLSDTALRNSSCVRNNFGYKI